MKRVFGQKRAGIYILDIDQERTMKNDFQTKGNEHIARRYSG